MQRLGYFHMCSLSGMHVLSQVISSSSCEQKWSTHWHIQTKIRNKLSPEKTEKLVYVYLNSKMAATVRDNDNLKMFAWWNEDGGSNWEQWLSCFRSSFWLNTSIKLCVEFFFPSPFSSPRQRSWILADKKEFRSHYWARGPRGSFRVFFIAFAHFPLIKTFQFLLLTVTLQCKTIPITSAGLRSLPVMTFPAQFPTPYQHYHSIPRGHPAFHRGSHSEAYRQSSSNSQRTSIGGPRRCRSRHGTPRSASILTSSKNWKRSPPA